MLSFFTLFCGTQTKGYCVNLPVFICVNLLTWHADNGQLHITIEQGGAALKLCATSHSCYVIRCVRPGRVLGLAENPVLVPPVYTQTFLLYGLLELNVFWRSRQFGTIAEVSTLQHWCLSVQTLRHQSDGTEMSWVRPSK